MSPSDYVEARKLTGSFFIVDGKPYYPHLRADTSDLSSIRKVALTVLCGRDESSESDSITVTIVTGGITNALYRVSGLVSHTNVDSVLVRIFGAEGMINRDEENHIFAKLSEKGIAPSYYGRFGNGRLEGFLDNFEPLKVLDFQDQDTGDAIAEELAKLHFGFSIPREFQHEGRGPELWQKLFSWADQALKIHRYKTPGDQERALKFLNLSNISDELYILKEKILAMNARIVFCHNDLLAANVMRHLSNGTIQLIDFEYGGINYAAYDIANYFNEHAGGTTAQDNGVPNYTLVPSIQSQKRFISKYISMAKTVTEIGDEWDMDIFLREVHAFMLVNHLYWGLWAVNQAAVEGTETFDYLTYAIHRFQRFEESKLID